MASKGLPMVSKAWQMVSSVLQRRWCAVLITQQNEKMRLSRKKQGGGGIAQIATITFAHAVLDAYPLSYECERLFAVDDMHLT